MIVMKFGGTSLQDETAISRAAEAVSNHIHQKPVVVLSAMGKTTDRLMEIAAAAHQKQRDTAQALTNELREYHLSVAAQLLSGTCLAQTENELGRFFEEISHTTQGLDLLGEFSPRSKDAVAAFGELMSTGIFVQLLHEKGYPALLLDSRELIRTDSNFTQATVLQEVSFQNVRDKVIPLVDEGNIVVLQGFIGSTPDGITTTVGRGGSDFTASLVGTALEAEDIQIWTDVPGILTTDPSIVPKAFKIKAISFDEASELAYFGARVLHPSTLLPAMERNIPVHVCSSSNIDQPGTLISAHSVGSATPIKAIACKKGITIVNIRSTRMLLAHGFLHRIFEVFQQHQTIVDVVSTSEVSVSLTIDSTQRLKAIQADLEDFSEVSVEPHMAIICAVGDNVRYTAGLASRIFRAVGDINVHMVSSGASRINVTFLVKDDKMEETVRRLHAEFFRDPDPELFEPCQ